MFPFEHGPVIHLLFEAAAISIGFRWYLVQRNRDEKLNSQGENSRFILLVGCLLGAAIGNKALFWIEFPHLLPITSPGDLIFGGQSIVGGLLGGLIGIELAKRQIGYRHSTGDYFVFPLLLGIFIGRIGCFLAGLSDGTFGNATSMPWGIDFGDGIPRHPTQLYEMIFIAILGLLLFHYRQRFSTQAGLLFKVMLSAYLLWRFFIDFLKPMPYVYFGGLSGIQLVALIALLFYLPLTWHQARKLNHA